MSPSRACPHLVLSLLISCVSSQALLAQAPTASTVTASAPAPAAPANPARPNPDLLTAEEIAAARVATAYEAVDRLRRPWFKDRLSGKPVSVYSDDNQDLNGAEGLRQVPGGDIAELRHLSGQEATRRWPAAVGGAIIVVRRR